MANFSKNFLLNEKIIFGIGASIASFLFFFLLGYLSKVLSRYVDIVMLRTNKHSTITEFASNSSVPVINGLSDRSHPCQVLTDLMTFEENRGKIDGSVVTWFGPGNNMTHSWIHAASLLDFELRICSPENFGADLGIIKKAKDEGANIIDNILPEDAAKASNCIVTDTWFSMGDKEDSSKRKILENYQVTNDLMNLAKDDVVFLHCLPAHRGEEVTDEVIDGNKSFVWDEAENRVHAQKGIIDWCFS